MGHWLKAQHKIPDCIVSSPAERALQTAIYCAEAMNLPRTSIKADMRIYEAGGADLLCVLNDQPVDAERVLLVGHNPGLERLLAYLSTLLLPVNAEGQLFATATLAELIFESGLTVLSEKTKAQAIRLIRPEALPDLA